jgi:DNA-binding NarL/FixJ family response regulator
MSALCLVLSDDLLDASRVTGHGQAAGLLVVHCRDLRTLRAAVTSNPALVILDLHHPELDAATHVPQLKAAGARVVGYGSHVDAARLKAARQAGCDEVLPRSAFFEDLEAHLRTWTAAKPAGRQELPPTTTSE